jgi:hypothetical protein
MRIAPLSIRLALLATVTYGATVAAQATVTAQDSKHAVVEVTARDSTGLPVPQAEITITRALRDVVARGITDSTGHTVLVVELKDSADFHLTMRKIGYIVPPRRSTELAPMRITAMSSLQYKSYHLDADDIEAADMPLYNGWDAVKRLRPDMLTSRGGCATGALQIWVNGKRIRLPLQPTGINAANALVGVPPSARFSYWPVSVLQEIAPEHIREIVYHDCFDTSMAAVGSDNAIFVILQPGVVYQENVGSFVLSEITSGTP